MTPSTRSRVARLGGLLLAAVLLSAGALPASASPDDDLDQTIDPNQQQGTGQTVLAAGHADIGPTLGTGQWTLQVHDDTSSPAAWRNPEDVVFQAVDASILDVPDDDAFAFLELPAGTEAYVLPQTEQPGIVWPGWNTQDPALLENLDLGTTLRFHAVEGPGDLVVYLQGGNFGAPEV
ncbi:choice-of-anchor M domain-containing protein, partial [Microbacterium sp.]|uniref:choice-of-anchor M domain-containing protein n=1 Tax=Microbacterium sp. TaxID=51671 RepID=UPI003A8B9669